MLRRLLLTSFALAAFASAGCASHGPSNSTTEATATAELARLPDVTIPDAVKAKRPAWITEVSPVKVAPAGAQIRIRFANDVVPVEMLEAPDRQAALAKVEISPQIPGRFSFVTPRMIAFSADRPLPGSSRFVVTLRAGFADLKGNALASDLAYTFTTERVDLSIVNALSDPPQGDRPQIRIRSSVPLDEASLESRAHLTDSAGKTIALSIVRPSPAPSASATPEASTSSDGSTETEYRLVPKSAVALASTYAIGVDSGVRTRYGNIGSAYDYKASLRTYGPLKFHDVSLDTGAAGRPFVSGNPTLEFSNAIDSATIDKAIALSPAPKRGYTMFAPDGSTGVQINPNGLEPDTAYTVRVAASLADTFGQALNHSAVATFRTGDLAPSLWAPDGYAIFPSTMNVALDVATANLPDDAYRAKYVRLQPSSVISTDPSSSADLDAVFGGKDDAWPAVAAPHTSNVETTLRVPLAKTLAGPTGLFAYGIAADYRLPGVEATHQHIDGAVLLTNVGVFAQWFPAGGFVRAHHLSDGAPIANAKVDVYESKPSAGSGEACASGSTDATGTLLFSKQQFARCASLAKRDDEAPELVAIVHDGNDWAFVRTSAYGQGLGDAAYASWSAGLPHPRGTFVSDRQLYQRGETAYFTGFGYFETAGAIVRGASPRFTVVAKSPQGTEIDLGSHALDVFGSFDVTFAVPPEADLGDWSIAATGTHGEHFDGTFTVAEFKPPTFKVVVGVDAKIAVPGDVVHATTKSAYLFGAPLSRGAEHVTVTRSRSSFTPKGYESYNYGPLYLYPENAPDLDANVSESDVTTAADGSSSLPVPVATDLPFPADYRIDGEVKDVSNLAVGDSADFTALPSRDLIVLRGDFLGQADAPYGFDFAVVDPDGKTIASKAVHFTLARRVYDTATQLVEGSETPHDAVHYETVKEFDATSASAVQHLSALPGKGGEYRLRANLPGATSDATATDLDIWIAGADANWYRSDDTSLKITLDRKTYRPGDTAHALIASPYDDAELLFAVVRGGALVRKTMRVHGATANVAFAVTPDMLPNVAVEAILVRRGPPIDTDSAKKIAQLSRAGFATVSVALDSKYVTVSAKPRIASLGPGAMQHVALHVADASGKPLQAEVTLAVANDAILQLSGYRFPDLVKQVYADLPISTRYADNRGDVKLQSEAEPVEKGFGYGGGAMAGPAGTRVRTKFRPVAFFDGSVRTDANGDATVSFTLPDDLTTWRVLALARTRDTRFGITDATFVATKPLVTTPILPQFARPGDVLDGGVSVTNVSALAPGADAGNIDLAAQLSGPLIFGDQPAATPSGAAASASAATPAIMPSGALQPRDRSAAQSKTTTTQFDGPTAGYRFAMLVDTSREAASAGAVPDAQVQFISKLGGASDAFRVPLPIVTDDIMESVVDTGTTSASTRVPLTVDASLPDDAGVLHVTLASTLLGNTLAPLDAVLARNPPPFGFEIAGRIAIAADRILLEKKYGNTADVPQLLRSIARDRHDLRALARDDGSYAFFPQGGSDPFTTAFVAIQLAQAQKAGVDVANDLASIKAYLREVLADPTRWDPGCKSPECKAETRLEALETLAPLGDVRSDFLSDIYDDRDRMSYYERVELARHLVRLPEWRAKGIALRDTLLEQLYETGRFAGLVQENDYGETPVDGQSQLLGLMIETAMPGERIDRAFDSLLAQRGRDGTWGCTCDDAEATNAVVLYADLDRTPPAFTATTQVAGGTAFAQKFEGYTITQVTKDTAMANLPRGKSSVTLSKRGTGTLHYTVDFDYAIRGANAGRYQGIRIDRIVRPADATGDPIVTFGLAAPTASVALEAGNVYDIEDRITTDHPLEGLVVKDSLAAGLEAIDTRFATNSTRIFESISDWNIDYQTIERSRVVTYARGVQPGVYAFHYLVRTVTPGTYAWPSATASLALAPDEFGRTSSGTLVIK